MRVVRTALVIGIFLLASKGYASGVWTYVDANGVTHIGNAAPPLVKRLEWLGFDDRLRSPVRPTSATHITRLTGYAAARPLLDAAAKRADVDPALVTAIAAAESRFRPDAVSHKGAVGLMQVMPATAARYGVSAPDLQQVSALLKDPDINAQVATRYLADLVRMFDGELELVIAAYNAGEAAVLRHGRRIPPYPETQHYVTRVMRYYQTLTARTS